MTLADLLIEPDWKAKAACRDLDHRIFFPDSQGPSDRRAKRICQGCSVRLECLDEALSYGAHYDYGIFGGTNAKERRKLRRQKARAA